MEAETAMIQTLRKDPTARLIALAALRANRDPLTELGFENHPLTPHLSAFLLQITAQKFEEGPDESEVQQWAAEKQKQYEIKRLWGKAIGTIQGGFEGLRTPYPKIETNFTPR